MELALVFRAMAHNNQNWEIAEAILKSWQKKVAEAKGKEESEKKRQKSAVRRCRQYVEQSYN